MTGLLDPDGTLPEPAEDLAAQLAAVADPSNPKDAMFAADGGAGGAFITSNPAKLEAFARGPITDGAMARLLGYPESKRAALAAGGRLRVLQALDPAGAVVHEHAVSEAASPAAARRAAAMVPGGKVRFVTLQQAVARRAGLLG